MVDEIDNKPCVYIIERKIEQLTRANTSEKKKLKLPFQDSR